MSILIQKVRLIDPEKGTDKLCDVRLDAGRLIEMGDLSPTSLEHVLDGSGLCAAPGLIDLHCHLREPGLTHKETIKTGAQAAAAGGFTTVFCMPNTSPVTDTEEAVRAVYELAKNAAAEVFVIAAVSEASAGHRRTDFAAIKRAGALGVSDDGLPVMDDALMEEALLEAKQAGLFVASHCEDFSVSKGGVMNEGVVSRRLGVPGTSNETEDRMIARDIALSEKTGCPVHICHVSTAGGVALVRAAKARGAKVTAETCPHYVALTDELIEVQGAWAKVNPPLRTGNDVTAVVEGLTDGTLDVMATDHAPHAAREKESGLLAAPSGFTGFETAFAVCMTCLVKPGRLSLHELLYKMTLAPAKIAGIPRGMLSFERRCDLMLFDPEEKWTVDPAAFKSMGKNTPYKGMTLTGRVKYTISNGRIYENGNLIFEDKR